MTKRELGTCTSKARCWTYCKVVGFLLGLLQGAIALLSHGAGACLDPLSCAAQCAAVRAAGLRSHALRRMNIRRSVGRWRITAQFQGQGIKALASHCECRQERLLWAPAVASRNRAPQAREAWALPQEDETSLSLVVSPLACPPVMIASLTTSDHHNQSGGAARSTASPECDISRQYL